MAEIELKAQKLSIEDNTTNVEMSDDEIWFLKYFIKEFNPKKIVEVGISAGGNTVNLLNWKDNDALLFSIDIATNWYRDKTKLSGFMADEVENKENFMIYRGYDYLDVYKEIGNDIDLIIIDTVHVMPGEFLTFLTALPQLKDGCIVILHDIHLNMIKIINNKFSEYETSEFCTGLLYGGVSSNEKYSLESEKVSNIGAFVVDDSTRDSIKDIFRILCSKWFNFPNELNLPQYCDYINEHYPIECYKLFKNCLELQEKYFEHEREESKKAAKELKKNKKLMNSIKDKDKKIDSLKKENELMKSTVSWKITKPLRYLSKMLK